MGRKILMLCSSPRKKGNTNTIVEWVANSATLAGAEVKRIDVASLHYKVNGCTACMGCQKSEKFECVIDDEASPIIASVPEYDVVVFATPVYFFGPNAQLKLFMDRMYSLAKFKADSFEFVHHFDKQQWCVIVTAGGPEEPCIQPTRHTFETIAGFVGVPLEVFSVELAPADPAEIHGRKDLREKAESLGRRLAGS